MKSMSSVKSGSESRQGNIDSQTFAVWIQDLSMYYEFLGHESLSILKCKYKEHLSTSKFQSKLSLLFIICYYPYCFLSINTYLLQLTFQQNKVNFLKMNQHIVGILIIIYFIFLNIRNMLRIVTYRSSHHLTHHCQAIHCRYKGIYNLVGKQICQ